MNDVHSDKLSSISGNPLKREKYIRVMLLMASVVILIDIGLWLWLWLTPPSEPPPVVNDNQSISVLEQLTPEQMAAKAKAIKNIDKSTVKLTPAQSLEKKAAIEATRRINQE